MQYTDHISGAFGQSHSQRSQGPRLKSRFHIAQSQQRVEAQGIDSGNGNKDDK